MIYIFTLGVGLKCLCKIHLNTQWGALCVQMDFTRTFQTTTKCNNMNHVWSHFYKILVVLKYRRRPWVNIFGTDISRCIYTYIKVVYLAYFGIFMLLKLSVSNILAQGCLWYFKTTKILKKWLQTWFILLHLALASNFRVKSIWRHSKWGWGGIWIFEKRIALSEKKRHL